MSQKVSTLPELINGNLVDADLLYVVDTSDAISKKILASSVYTYTLNKLENANKVLPDLPGSATVFLNGTGAFSASVTNVTGVSPISVASGTTTPQISINIADETTDGYLSAQSFAIFDGKQENLVSGTNIKTVNSTSLLGAGDVSVGVTSVTGTAPISSTGGATPIISMPAASGGTSGYLLSTDWSFFNVKQELKKPFNISEIEITASIEHNNKCIVLTNSEGSIYTIDEQINILEDGAEIMLVFLGATNLVKSSIGVTLNGVTNNTTGVSIPAYKPTLIKKIANSTFVVG